MFLLPLEIADFGYAAAEAYGRIRATLEAAGTPIGPLDTLIAGHAVSLNTILVTDNVAELQPRARLADRELAAMITSPAAPSPARRGGDSHDTPLAPSLTSPSPPLSPPRSAGTRSWRRRSRAAG